MTVAVNVSHAPEERYWRRHELTSSTLGWLLGASAKTLDTDKHPAVALTESVLEKEEENLLGKKVYINDITVYINFNSRGIILKRLGGFKPVTVTIPGRLIQVESIGQGLGQSRNS
ncbi:hypothetical protein RRG08_026312 [Elysia crispata]|uniref:Uncharacterized protein n=1 Tax=Elysia crispata TaxID=231223 RepID=A0AAE0ZAR1_9GAST|nr:hypothetical protein RRG08_026312 [Elysia crispata]